MTDGTPVSIFDTSANSVVATVIRRFITACEEHQFFHLQFTPTQIKDYQLNAFTKNFFVWTHLDKIIHSTADKNSTLVVSGDDRRFSTGESWIMYDAGPEARDCNNRIYRETNNLHITRALAANLRNHTQHYLLVLNKIDNVSKKDIGLGSLPEAPPSFTLDDIKTFLAGCYLESQSAWTRDDDCTKLVLDKQPAKQLHEVYAGLYYNHLRGVNKLVIDPEQRIDYAIFQRLKRVFGDPFKE